jgi:death-on-curing protein
MESPRASEMRDCSKAAALAATHAYPVARNPPFVDGNKRSACAALRTFLDLNGAPFDPPEAEAVVMARALASGEIDDAVFGRWVRESARAPGSGG